MFARSDRPRYTAQEYLALERQSKARHELIDGEMLAMTGASISHNRICSNLVHQLVEALGSRPCDVFANDMRVGVGRDGSYVYPDVAIVCGEPEMEDEHLDTLLNPSVIVEVLSPSTEAYDRGAKFARYRKLESLRDYVLVAQDRPSIEVYSREGEMWRIEGVDGLDGQVQLPSLGLGLAIEAVYRRVEWPEA